MRPKVLIIIDTGIIGGPGKGLFQLLRNSPDLSYVLCNFRYENPRSTEFVDYAANNGFPLELLSQRFRFDPKPIREAAALVREHGCNIVQSHGYKSHAVAAIVSRREKIPWVAVAHGWTSEDRKVRIYHALDRLLLGGADAVITVSRKLFETISPWRRGKRTEVISNAVEIPPAVPPETRLALREEAGALPGEHLLGCIGRLSSEKGQRFLLEALSGLSPDMRAIFLGDGPDGTELERLASELGIADRIRFLGHRSNVSDYYAAIDLLVLPSLSEGLPNVVLEAMAAGTPVVASDVGAVREIITDGDNGWMVPPGDVAALRGAIEKALNQRDLAEIGAKAKASLHPKFSARERARRFMAVYESVLAGER